MESGKYKLENVAEAEVNNTTNKSVATYKSLADVELNQQQLKTEKENESNMGQKVGETGTIDDGAGEKMLNEELTKNTEKNATEVIFMAENGDAKIDMENIKPTLCGMGKEELMKYANDPFWVRLRWILFFGFWLLWFAMLGGAIAIIIMAPKCASPQPKTWWEESPIIQIESSEIAGKDVKLFMDNLKNQNIKTISLVSILKGTPGHVENFTDVNSDIGGLEFVKNIIAAAKKNDQRVLLEFDPNHSSINHPWFDFSIKKIHPYIDFYVWASPSSNSELPNEWKNDKGESAWTWNEKRQQYYLHQFSESQPDLNFHNTTVVEEFNKIFKFWINLGISGFRLGTTRYLTEGKSPANYDPRSVNIDTQDNYDENIKVLKQWRDTVKNLTDNLGLFTLNDDIAHNIIAIYNENERLIDLPQHSEFLTTADASITAQDLQSNISMWVSTPNVTWPSWDVNGKNKSLRQRMDPNIANSIVMMTMLLPGTPILKLNDTIWSTGEELKTLFEKRSEKTFLYGNFTSYVFNDTFVYTIEHSGLPSYLVAYHSSNTTGTIDVSMLESVPADMTVLTSSPNYIRKDGNVINKVESARIEMPARSTLVLSFASERED